MRNLTPKDLKALREFDTVFNSLKKQNKLILKETLKEKKERKERLLTSYKDFVEFYFVPHLIDKKGTVAKFQIDAVNEAVENKNYLHVAQWARGHAKSLTFGCFLPLFLMLKGELSYMLLVGRSKDSAVELLSALRLELLTNIRLIADYGNFFKRQNIKPDEFLTTKNVKFKALGIQGDARGTRHQKHRVDYIVLDDVDTNTMCRNKERVNSAYEWVKGSLLNTSGTSGRFIACGNKISVNSIIQKLEDDEAFTTSVVNAVDENGKVTWGEYYTQEVIDRKIKVAGKRVANAEFMNKPTISGAIFKDEWLIFENIRAEAFEYKVAYLDPSKSNSEFADFKAIATVGYKNNRFYILDIFCRKTSMRTVGHYFFDIEKRWGQDVVFVTETIFGQNSQFRDFDDVYKEVGRELCVLSDNKPKTDKIFRINNLDAFFQTQKIIINKDIMHTPDYKEFEYQLMSFPNKSVHDDAPDALEGAIRFIKDKVATLTLSTIGQFEQTNFF